MNKIKWVKKRLIVLALICTMLFNLSGYAAVFALDANEFEYQNTELSDVISSEGSNQEIDLENSEQETDLDGESDQNEDDEASNKDLDSETDSDNILDGELTDDSDETDNDPNQESDLADSELTDDTDKTGNDPEQESDLENSELTDDDTETKQINAEQENTDISMNENTKDEQIDTEQNNTDEIETKQNDTEESLVMMNINKEIEEETTDKAENNIEAVGNQEEVTVYSSEKTEPISVAIPINVVLQTVDLFENLVTFDISTDHAVNALHPPSAILILKDINGNEIDRNIVNEWSNESGSAFHYGFIKFDSIEYTGEGQYTYTLEPFFFEQEKADSAFITESMEISFGIKKDESGILRVVSSSDYDKLISDSFDGDYTDIKWDYDFSDVKFQYTLVASLYSSFDYYTDSISIPITKNIDGISGSNDTFEFAFETSDGLKETFTCGIGKTSLDYTDNINMSKASLGNYKVTITENDTGGNWDYDNSVWTVYYYLTYGEVFIGSIMKDGEYIDSGGVEFTNTYTGYTGTTNIQMNKTDGYGSLLPGAEFTLFGDMLYDNIMVNGKSVSVTNGTSEVFGTDENGIAKITGLTEGTYIITEVTVPSGYLKRDPVTIVLSYDKSSASWLCTKDGELVTLFGETFIFDFENDYEFSPDSFSIVIPVNKIIEGIEDTNEMFIFTIKDNDGTVYDKKYIIGEGAINLEYKANYTGKYEFIIAEEGGSAGGWKYDTSEYVININVINCSLSNFDYEISITLDGNPVDEIVFINTYSDPAQISVELPFTGGTGKNSFYFFGVIMLMPAVLLLINRRKLRIYSD